MNRQEFWRGRSVLVTGATGLLGGWMVKELLELGANVVALVRDNVPGSMAVRSGLFGKVPTVNGSLTDMALIRRTLAEYGVQTVLHLAAQTLVGVAKIDPVGTLEANVQGTWTLLDACRQLKIGQILVASSDKAYGDPIALPYTEDMPLKGRYPYDVSKSCVDLISSMYATTYDLPVGILRCGNLFGGGDLNFSRSIPGLMKAILLNETFYIRSDGKFVRDFLYAEDAVDAYLTFAERLAEDKSLHGEAFNFGLETRLNVLELVELTKNLAGAQNLKVVVQNIASGEVREQYLTAEKARQRLNWTPRCGMEEGLRRTLSWYREYLGVNTKPASAHA